MLIELALVLPTFFLLVFGIFNFSLVLLGRGNAICAANMAARYAALHSSTALAPSTTDSVKSYASGFLFTAPASGTVITPAYSAGNTVGGTVTVTVSMTYLTFLPFYKNSSITVSGSAQRTITR
jgi:Flp pilus assembly protein TadG